jgi:CelD/BcsL family acetyltransferase involved in cellulose biosynthesis
LKLELINVFKESGRVEAIWKKLLSAGGYSYFLSWPWIENWIASLPQTSGLKLALFLQNGEPALGCFLGHAKVVRQGVFRSTAYLMNQTGNRVYDQLYVEYNSLIGKGVNVGLQQILELLPGKWEELYLSGLDAEAFPGRVLNQDINGYQVMVARTIPSYYVDLNLVRERGDYLRLLSANARSQIRRCLKLYEARGPISREVATTADQALKIFDEMVKLHQHSWSRRGQAGAFKTEYFYNFHKELIRKRASSGEIQLIRIGAGELTIGCLYNFCYEGRIYFYQSGLRYEKDNRLKPGLLCHYEAICYNAGQGNGFYDFLASFDDYKQRLSTHQRPLVWARVQKPHIKFDVERFVRGVALNLAARYRARRRPGTVAVKASV